MSNSQFIRRTFIDGVYGQMHIRMTESQIATPKTPLYCIHQSPSSSIVYNAILKTMGMDRISAAGDTPGFGESMAPDSVPEITDYAHAHGVAMDAIGFNGPVDLMGFFTGSKVAIALARQRPKQVRKLILLGLPVYTKNELIKEKKTYSENQYTWDGAHISKWWNHLRDNAPKNYPIELFVQHFAEIQRGGQKSWWGHRAAFNFDLETHLTRLKNPVLVLCTNDPQGRKSWRAKDLLENAEFLDVAHPGQGVMDLHTKLITGHMREFLDRPKDE